MKTGGDVEELKRFKQEATEILESARFPVHKWESNVPELDSETNPRKLLGVAWNKKEDTLEIQAQREEVKPVTKRSILSQLSSIYDPLGLILFGNIHTQNTRFLRTVNYLFPTSHFLHSDNIRLHSIHVSSEYIVSNL